jgi:hypothetical protein
LRLFSLCCTALPTLGNSTLSFRSAWRRIAPFCSKKAAEQAAEQDGATNLNCSGKLRDLASAAARLFGWDSDKPAVQFDQLVVTPEQLEQIRALRES